VRRAAPALLCAAALGAWPASAVAARAGRSVLVVFLPAGEQQLAGVPGMSVGIVSAAQDQYSPAQFLLDMSQGARVASSSYPSPTPPALSLAPSGGGAVIEGWAAARGRAERAPQLLQPGLLAAEVPGGAAYAGVAEAPSATRRVGGAGSPTGPAGAHLDGVLAADRRGRVAAVSLGSAATLLTRVRALCRSRRLVVADLPGGPRGLADVRALSAGRPPQELLIVLQRAPGTRGNELLWSAVAGLAGGGDRELTSQSTNERGLVVAVDVAPTILVHLGVAIPADVRGKPIVTDGRLDSAGLRALMARLHVIGPRRLRAFGWLLVAWLALLVAAVCWPRAGRRGRALAWAMRTGGLGVLWAPLVTLAPAALEPSAPVEYAIIAVLCLALGALTDALVPWPRAPLVAALTTIFVLTVDALAGTQLLMRSLLGPDPILGARFYGIGNELKSGLAVLVLAGVAAALYPAARGRRAALSMAGAGVILAVVEGSARIGAGVGGVILVSFGFALATAMLLPGAPTRRRALVVLISPVVGLVALAALDLATAHGAGHFTGSVLHARSAGDLRDVIVRRYGAAWDELHNHAMPIATAVALAFAAAGVRWRDRLLVPVRGDPAWLAALAGGLAGGVVGSLVEDSGPVLLVVAVFALGCVVSYLWGRPRALADPGPAPTMRPASRPLERSYASRPGMGSTGSGP
jgi:hypothetical protein